MMSRCAFGAMATGLVIVACVIASGCSSTATLPTYSQADLKVICERTGGWWRANDLMGGYCEYQGTQR